MRIAARTGSWTLVLALLAAAAPALPACRARTREQPDPQARTVLRVENRNFADMTIYVIPEGGTRLRLGTATGNSTTRFTIPAHLIFGATSLRFIADPIGGAAAPVTDDIVVRPGDEIGMIIPPG